MVLFGTKEIGIYDLEFKKGEHPPGGTPADSPLFSLLPFVFCLDLFIFV
jgi:hypothetical protein